MGYAWYGAGSKTDSFARALVSGDARCRRSWRLSFAAKLIIGHLAMDFGHIKGCQTCYLQAGLAKAQMSTLNIYLQGF